MARLAAWGAEVQGDFLLTQGEVLQIAVGGAGTTGFFHNTITPFPAGAAGGGGGSFIVGPGNAPLVIAGGGGGAANVFNGGDALTGTQGGAGGSGGQGGAAALGPSAAAAGFSVRERNLLVETILSAAAAHSPD